MLAEMGVDEPGLDVLARVGFDTLGLQTYLTAGPKESRAWTIRKGATAPEAAGVIHTDFQKGFIKAEIVSFDDLIAAGSMAEGQGAPARCGWRARTTSWPTATWWSSASTCEPGVCAGQRGLAPPSPHRVRKNFSKALSSIDVTAGVQAAPMCAPRRRHSAGLGVHGRRCPGSSQPPASISSPVYSAAFIALIASAARRPEAQ